MALNVTTAVFGENCNTATASPSLAQWDVGQILKIEGVDLPSAYQVDFSTEYTRNAIQRIGNAAGVAIPNELLQRSAPITAYIVLHEGENDRETEYWITIHITPRTPPETITPDPEEQSVIDETIAALQDGVAAAEAAATSAEGSASDAADHAADAEAWAVGQRAGADVPDTDPTYHNNSKYYAGRAEAAAEEAGQHEASWESWARRAETAAGNAEGSATAAGQSKTAAEAAAQTATQKATEAGNSAAAAAGSAASARQTVDGAIGAINTAKEGALTAIGAAGSNAVGAVEQEGTTQVNRVQTKGDEVISSIPQDYTDLVDDVADLSRQLSDVEENQIPELKNVIGQIDDIVYLEQTSSMVNQSSSLATANAMWGFSIPGITAKRIIVAPKWNVDSGTYVAKRWRPTDGTLVDKTYVTEVESKTGTIGEAVSFDDVTENDAFTFLSNVPTDRMYYCSSGSQTYNVPLIKVDTVSGSQNYRYTVQPLYFPALQLDIVEQYSKIDAIQGQGEENAENVRDIEGILFDAPNGPEYTWDIGTYINSSNGAVIAQNNAAIWHDFVTVDDYKTIDLDIDYPADPRSLQAQWSVFTYRLDGTYVGYEWFSFDTNRVRVLKPEYKYRFGVYAGNLSGFTFSEVLAMVNFHWDIKTEDEIGLISKVETLEDDFNLVYNINKEVNGGGAELHFFIEKGSINTSTGEDSTSSNPDTSVDGRSIGYYESDGDNIIISAPVGGRCLVYEYSSDSPSGFIRIISPANTDGITYVSSPYTLETTSGYFYRFTFSLNNSYNWQDGQKYFKDFTFVLQSTAVEGLEKRVTALEQKSGSDKIFTGKKCVTLGDSITYRNVFQPVVNEALGMTMVNKGIGSTKLSGGNTDSSAMSSDTRLNGVLTENPDYVTVLGGANDLVDDTPIGTDAQFDLPLASKDRTTFIGAYSYIVEYLLGQDPTLNIMILGTTWAHNDGASYSETMTYTMYSDASNLVAQHYGLPFVDLHGECGFNKFTMGSAPANQIYSTDQIHPNAEGGKRIASLVIAKMIEAWKYTI